MAIAKKLSGAELAPIGNLQIGDTVLAPGYEPYATVIKSFGNGNIEVMTTDGKFWEDEEKIFTPITVNKQEIHKAGVIGACGEHYVAAFVSGFKLVVAMPRGGTAGSDLFVCRENRGRVLRVQVKTGGDAARKYHKPVQSEIYLWFASYKLIDQVDKNLWYAFVFLNGWPEKKRDNLPEVFFIPSNVVSDCLKRLREEHDKFPMYWLTVADAEKFKGNAGLEAMMKALDS